MPQIIVTQPFKFAHHGYRVQEFEPAAEPVQTTDECAELAVLHGWAQLVPAAEQTSATDTDPPAAEQKADSAAPENKDAAPRRARKHDAA